MLKLHGSWLHYQLQRLYIKWSALTEIEKILVSYCALCCTIGLLVFLTSEKVIMTSLDLSLESYYFADINGSNKQSSLNILITMAITCKYDINKLVTSLQYNKHELDVFWFFNIYNAERCNHSFSSYDDFATKPNICIINKNISKINFWINHVNTENIERYFNMSIDYIWLIDDDFLLEYFNFNSFIKISSKVHSAISQPITMSRCSNCRGSDHSFLNHYNEDLKNKFGLIAKTSSMIEMGSPLFRFNVWSLVHPYITQQFEMNRDLNHTEWGPDMWWCGAAKTLIESQFENNCVIIYYTPLMHMDKRSTIKTDEYINDGREMISRLKEQYKDFYDPKLFKPVQEFYANHV